jgi:hypothetical protein
MGVCVRTEEYKMCSARRLAAGELYDLKKDPSETNNIWDASNARPARDMMMQLLASRMIDTVDPLPERRCMW